MHILACHFLMTLLHYLDTLDQSEPEIILALIYRIISQQNLLAQQ